MVKLTVPESTYQCEICGGWEFLPVKFERLDQSTQATLMCLRCGPREGGTPHTDRCKHEERTQ